MTRARVASTRTRRPRALAPAMLFVLALTTLPGCSGTLIGHWRMVEVVPNRQVFSIDNATFNRDGTYTATTIIKGKTLDESGRYEFNGFKLTFQPDGGGRRQYNALLKLNELEITDAKLKVVLRKQ